MPYINPGGAAASSRHGRGGAQEVESNDTGATATTAG